MAEEGSFLSDHEARVVVQRSQGLESFDIVGVRVEPWSSEHTGYCSTQLRVIIEFKLHSGNNLELKFFAKSIPNFKDQEPNLLQYYSQYFRCEFVFFSEILPAFGVVSDSFTPRCFYSRKDLLVMEDLSREGFTPPSARDLMTYDECMATLRALSRLHAASIAFEEHQPERKTVADSWPDIFDMDTTVLGEADGWLLTGVKTLEYLTDIVPGIYDREMLKNLLRENRNQIINAYTNHEKTSYFRKVLSHGDIWQSNTLRRLV